MYIPRICHCGLPTVLRTSWTATNPGRRFHCCPKTVIINDLQGQDSCGFNGFYDPPMCPRSVQIIPGLLRNINHVQEVATNNERRDTMFKNLLLLSWLVFGVYFMLN
ncbi:zinc finger, GRF-type [Artemisia annua]|uniref:Zinc finger, GRF-type n=1 Tax=Artemisia annua TaxID=35608 RepID=A0A2U1KNC1_ARTAN|nr:zinc finger, GRF-type [Artemisia annua]